MVRLMLTLTPCVCVLAAIGFSNTLDHYLCEKDQLSPILSKEEKKIKKIENVKKEVSVKSVRF